jgi:hypothetical protein
MPHRTALDGRVRVADLHMQILGVPAENPDLAITPAYARQLAVELVERADAAEGYEGPHGFVTRWDVLAELAQLREDVERLRAQRADYWTA